jgi:ASC-1-like (ASCH) protein
LKELDKNLRSLDDIIYSFEMMTTSIDLDVRTYHTFNNILEDLRMIYGAIDNVIVRIVADRLL